MEFTAEQIQKKFESLPEDVKKAVSSVDTTDTLIDIGEKYKLHVDKMGELVDETTLVMLGFKPTSGFVNSVKSRLGISQEVAEGVVKDVNEQILVKVRESLRKMHEEPKEEILPLDEIKPVVEKTEVVVEKPSVEIPQTETPKIDLQTIPSVGVGVGQNIVEPKPTEDVVKKEEITPSSIQPEGVKTEGQEVLKREDVLKGIEDPLGMTDKIQDTSSVVGQVGGVEQKRITNDESRIKEVDFAKQNQPDTTPLTVSTEVSEPQTESSEPQVQEDKKDVVTQEQTIGESLEKTPQDLVSDDLSTEVQKKPMIPVKEPVVVSSETPLIERVTPTPPLEDTVIYDNLPLTGQAQLESTVTSGDLALTEQAPLEPATVSDSLPLTEQATSDIVESKLTQVVKEPIVEEKVVVVEEGEKQTPAPAVDPYREPIE